MTANPLIAESAEGSSWTQQTAGAGLFYDAAATAEAFEGGDWVGAGVTVAGDALDVLSFVEDPLTGLLSAGIGWLMEHIKFVSELLDYLAGNAELVMEKQQTWNNVHDALLKAAHDYNASASATQDIFTGQAGDLYRTSVQNYAKAASGAAAEAANAATAIGVAGAIVGTTRGIVRDLISRFVAQAIEKAAIALATSWCSFGASIAAYIADEVGEASATAAAESAKVSKLVQELRQLQSAAEKSGAKVADYGAKIGLKRAEIREAAGTAAQSVKTAAADVEQSIDRAASSFGKAKSGGWEPGEYFDALAQNTTALKQASQLGHDAADVSAAGKVIKKGGGTVVQDARHVRDDVASRIETLYRQRQELLDSLPKAKDKMLENVTSSLRPVPRGGSLDQQLDRLKEWDEANGRTFTIGGHSVTISAVNEKMRSAVEEEIKQAYAEQPHRSHEAAAAATETTDDLPTGSLVGDD